MHSRFFCAAVAAVFLATAISSFILTPGHADGSVTTLANLAEIHGVKWNDLDGDSTKDAGEPGLPNWKIYLDSNQNGQWDAGEPFELTDASGAYAFTGLAAGTYVVGEAPQSGWGQTYPGAAALQAGSLSARKPIPPISTTRSKARAWLHSDEASVEPLTNVSKPLINMNAFRADARFAGVTGAGFAAAVLDTGIDLNHPFFGPDADTDGVADRIVYSYDFADNDADASDTNGHGSNVSSIVASQDATYGGMAPAADIIHLKVFSSIDGSGNFGDIESALQWVVANAEAYNIASVNMSLGDSGNYATPQELYGVDDEMAALEAMDVLVVSSAGNSFYSKGSVPGVAYPAADPNSMAVGATWDANNGGPFHWSSGAKDFSTAADRVVSFSQRHETMTEIFAPGALITGAGYTGGTVTYAGTSQASPHVAGIALLAQQLATQRLGRRLTMAEFISLLNSTGVSIVDGDDENDNVTNTGLTFKRVDMLALGNAIWNMGNPVPGAHTVTLADSQVLTGINFGNRLTGWTLAVLSPEGSGSTVPAAGSHTYGTADSAQVTATPASGWQLDRWEVDGLDAGTANPLSVGPGAQGQTIEVKAFFTALPADLSDTSLLLSPAPTAWGRTFDVHFTVENPGAGSAGAFRVGLYLSENSAYNPGTDVLLDTSSYTGLASAGTITDTISTLLPAASPFARAEGTFYIVKVVDDQSSVPEPNETNNIDSAPFEIGDAGLGLQGEYFHDIALSQPALTRIDPFVDFSWPRGTSPDPSMDGDTFSVRWSGTVKPAFTETYTFYTVSDDGSRLWVNGLQLTNDWSNHSARERSGSIALTAGQKYSIVMEYYDNTKDGSARLLWSSPSLVKEVVPQSRLYPPASPTPGPEIGLSGNGVNIASGDSTPSAGDGTDFGSAVANSGSAQRTFTVANTGTAALNLLNPPNPKLSGANAADFTVTQVAISPVAVSGTTSFIIRFAPSAIGLRQATVTVESDDADEGTYTFAIQGTGLDSSIGTGLQGQYFNDMTLTALALTRIDPIVDFSWPRGTSPDPAVNNDAFSVRWSGQVKALYSETYTFYTSSDDGSRLWVNGQLITNDWSDHSAREKSGTIALAAGQRYDIVMEYYDNTYDATARLSWSSPTQAKQVIPQACLYPPGPPPSGPEIGVSGNGAAIGSGDATPSAVDGTDFGSVIASSGNIEHSFTIANTGTTGLNLLNPPNPKISGAYAADFTVTQTASSPVSSGGTTTFTVRFTPSAIGLRNATVTIQSDDADEGTFTFAIQGTGLDASTGTGLQGEYFNDITLTALALTRIDPVVDFTWLRGTSPDPVVSNDAFSARWSGQVKALYSETYTFYTSSDDGSRLWVNGQLLTNDWSNHSAREKSGVIALVAGQRYDIVMEYYDSTLDASAKLSWSSPSQAKQIIPQACLYPPGPPPSGPEIDIRGNGLSISNGDVAPRSEDGTSFGGVVIAASVEHTFIAANVGASNLSFLNPPNPKISGPNAADFTVIQTLTSPVAAGGSAAFTIRFTPSALGLRQATVTVQSDDADEAIYTFAIQGTGLDASVGTGLTGQYFNDMTLSALALTRIDPVIDFTWLRGTSPDPAVNTDAFSVRWTGQVKPLYSQTYTFYTVSDDGVRLWVNGVQLINNWTNHSSTENMGNITLVAGQRYDIRMEYFDNTLDATARLLWSSASQTKQVIPQAYLYPN